jgi:hypothetical protein
MDTNTVVGVVSAVAAVGAAIVSWVVAGQTDKSAHAQQRLATHAAASDWLKDLREWANEGIDMLAQAAYTCAHSDETKKDCVDELRGCQHKISALVDRGRFFLPNQNVAEFGLEKPTAYRGWRHAALDPLVAAERVVSGKVGSGRFRSREEALIEMRREFVSAIQRILAPDQHNKEIARMIREGNEHRAEDRTLGGLLPDDKVIPTGAERLLFGAQPKHPINPPAV